ncbi:hypothetical protein [Streptomyces sp. NPDC057340]|uniref:barstar family protein n=1 Tax=Streptomyces sp. NPDC057340 TaxID=3346103 RepID=UPI00363196E2
MMWTVGEHDDDRATRRFRLTDTEDGLPWGICDSVDGLFGEPARGTYELFGWVPAAGEVRGWIGSRVWLLPDDAAAGGEDQGPWLLEDAESLGRPPGTDGLVLTGLDDYEGPPEGHRTPVRLHDGRRWLGRCREFTRVLAPERAAPPLVLRGLAPRERLRAALARGTRRSLDLEQAALEIRDDRGRLLTERLLWTRVTDWRPSSRGTDLIDLQLDGARYDPVPEHARPLWERRLAGPPDTPGTWARLDARGRAAWLELVREAGCRGPGRDRPAGHAYRLDGTHVTDEAGLYLALGEAVNGPGGYFGGCLAAVADCLRGGFGHTAPATLLWRDIGTAREHLSRTLTADGRPYDLFSAVLDVLAGGGMRVVPA